MSLPPGSWRKTAQDAVIRNGKLIAQLKNSKGDLVWAETVVKRGCAYENINGRFQVVSRSARQNFFDPRRPNPAPCTAFRGKRPARPTRPAAARASRASGSRASRAAAARPSRQGDRLPGGSWRSSARNFGVRNGVLYADLQCINGKWVKRSVKIRPGAEYSNKNGSFKESMNYKNTELFQKYGLVRTS